MQQEIFGPVLPICHLRDARPGHRLRQRLRVRADLVQSTRAAWIVAIAGLERAEFGETYVNRENFEAMQGFHRMEEVRHRRAPDGKHGLEEYLQTHVVYMNYRPQQAVGEGSCDSPLLV